MSLTKQETGIIKDVLSAITPDGHYLDERILVILKEFSKYDLPSSDDPQRIKAALQKLLNQFDS